MGNMSVSSWHMKASFIRMLSTVKENKLERVINFKGNTWMGVKLKELWYGNKIKRTTNISANLTKISNSKTRAHLKNKISVLIKAHLKMVRNKELEHTFTTMVWNIKEVIKMALSMEVGQFTIMMIRLLTRAVLWMTCLMDKVIYCKMVKKCMHNSKMVWMCWLYRKNKKILLITLHLLK